MAESRVSYSNFNDNAVRTSSKHSTKDKNVHGASSSTGTTGKKTSAAGALLKDKHPELFFVAPRPGGFIRHITSPHKDPSKTNIKEDEDAGPLQSHPSKKPAITGTETTPVSISEVLDTQIPCPAFHRFSKDEERNNMVRMCSIAISTVIMLAQHTYKDITLEHVRHTEAYFRALRQEDGYPQNIGQLMQILANLKRAGTIVTPPPDQKDSDEELDDAEDIQISDIIN